MINKGCQYVDNFLTYYNDCNFFLYEDQIL